ncbi:hypothetical protein [Persicirhabdus sediminis]|uniref:Uncharacterized protein n=1 Tax=Persicirhabdus sediminis TaxID=454144 RepID=A0A8J7MD16_9BACT|nr:hypothetical protein [Persicirhabdus sediminis]MBK1790336.1 hypothetical protein [Persicirhabdus sediminis]
MSTPSKLPLIISDNLDTDATFVGRELNGREMLVFKITRASGSWLLVKPTAFSADQGEQWIHPNSMDWAWNLYKEVQHAA